VHLGHADVPKVLHPVLDALPDRVLTAQIEQNVNEKTRTDTRGIPADSNQTGPNELPGSDQAVRVVINENDRRSAPMTSLRQRIELPEQGLIFRREIGPEGLDQSFDDLGYP
jgi:hypothetical protein